MAVVLVGSELYPTALAPYLRDDLAIRSGIAHDAGVETAVALRFLRLARQE